MYFLNSTGVNQVGSVENTLPEDILLPANINRLSKRTDNSGKKLFNDTINNSISLKDWVSNLINSGDIEIEGTVQNVDVDLTGNILTVSVNGISDNEDLSSLSGSSIIVEDVFTSTSIVNALSANRGRILFDNQSNILTSLGILSTDTDMGTYTGSIISDNVSQIVVNQELEDAISSSLSNTLNDGEIFVGNVSNIATPVTMSGDVIINNSGVTDITNSGVALGTYGSSLTIPQLSIQADGRINAANNIAIPNFTGATPTVGGVQGLVPNPSAGDDVRFLRGDGTWADVSGGLTDLTDSNIWVGDISNNPIEIALGTGFNITGGNLNVVSSTTTQSGIVELASVAEVQTGTDNSKAITPFGGEATYVKKIDFDAKGDALFGSADNTYSKIPRTNIYGAEFHEDDSTITGWNIRKNVTDAITPPTNTSDLTQGFAPLSRVIVNDTDLYVCLDNTLNNAVWIQSNNNYIASPVNELLGINISGNEIGLDITNRDALTDIVDSDEFIIHDRDTGINKKLTADNVLPKVFAHADEASVSPTISGNPDLSEIQTWATANNITDRVVKYTGTNIPGDITVNSYIADKNGTIIPCINSFSGNAEDGYHKDIVRTDSIPNVAPSGAEYSAPISGSSATVKLSNNSVEHWNYGVAWALQYTQNPTSRNYLMSGINIVTVDDFGSDTEITVDTDGGGNTTVTIPEGVEKFDACFPVEVIGETGSNETNIIFVFQGARVYNQSNLTMRYPEVDYINRDNEAFNSFDIQDEGVSPQIRFDNFSTSGHIKLIVNGTDAANTWTIKVRF